MSGSDNQDTSGKDISKSEYQEANTAEGREKPVVPGFEKLWVWQKAHKLMLEVHKICQTLPRRERFRIKGQIERASSSVPDNIAEGHTSYYYQDKIKGFYTARKEAGETQNHVRSLQGKNYLTRKVANDMVTRYEEVIRGINGYINWVREKRGDRK